MRIPLSWLKEYVDIDLPIPALAERLTLAGLEVETVDYIGLPGAKLPWDPDKIVVGEVVAVHPHPEADRLVLAEVNYGGPETEVVVSGPPSLKRIEGQSGLHLKVAFAFEGARLWDPYSAEPQIKTLKKSKIRGVLSRAMVCSEKELGLSDEHEDIIYLPDDAPVGMPLVDYLGDAVLEFEIKGPFAHLYSVVGVAREAAALLGVPLKRDVLEVLQRHPAELTPTPPFVELEIADPDLCPRYSAAYIVGVTVQPSPLWMQMRLRHAGMRPINNIVDVTNYVMLELGQPLHAFDYHVLRPRPGAQTPAIIVRRARPGEQMRTLDGELRTFDGEMLLITDGGGPVAVAGVMGGLDSEITDATTDILLESANFQFLNIRRTSRLLGLSSESSVRFGRRVDPELTVKAAARAAHLMVELGGGTVAPVIGDLYPGRQPLRTVELSPADVTHTLGIEIPPADIVRILTALEFTVRPTQLPPTNLPTYHVTIPSHRQDVMRPIDLVEEIGRVYGYDRFPATLIRDQMPPQRPNPRLEGSERVRDLLIGLGLDEVITYSLVDADEEDAFRPPDAPEHLRLLNPLASDRAALRQTLLPSLLHVARKNLRFLDRVAVFEIGAVYLPAEGQTLPAEPLRLGVVMTGPREGRSWIAGQDRSPMGFYELKGVVETLLARLGVEGTFAPHQHPAFHPGRCAQVSVGERALGVMGELHPQVRQAFDLPVQPVTALEFDLEKLLAVVDEGARKMKPLSTHPPVYEDLALVVDEAVPAANVYALIVRAGGALLRSAELFDVYRGEQVGAGRKSLAYRLTYQADDRTLSDQDVSKLRAKIVRTLERELGAALRG